MVSGCSTPPPDSAKLPLRVALSDETLGERLFVGTTNNATELQHRIWGTAICSLARGPLLTTQLRIIGAGGASPEQRGLVKWRSMTAARAGTHISQQICCF